MRVRKKEAEQSALEKTEVRSKKKRQNNATSSYWVTFITNSKIYENLGPSVSEFAHQNYKEELP